MSKGAIDMAFNERKETMQILTFQLDGEIYAVNVRGVIFVERVPDVIRSLPGYPSYFLGVAELRQSMLPIVKMSRRLKLTDKEKDNDSRILVVQNQGKYFGFLVDRAKNVKTVSLDSIEAPPEHNGVISEKYIIGIINQSDGIVTLLDIDNIVNFNLDELKPHNQVV